ncbi:MAG: rhodanese-like domain-containing protein [Myxococcaceae bacterium]
MRWLLILFLVVAASGCAGTISNEVAHQWVSEQHAVLLDVRSTGEFAEGHLDGAINVPVGELEGKLGTLPFGKDQPVVVYCHSGLRASRAMSVLKGAGFTKVESLGAMSNWK